MPENAPISRARARYMLGILALVYGFNMLDRQILGILLEPIKAEFDASDTAMGLLTGLAFALFYTTAGIPLARLSDGGARRTVLAAGLAAWSAMTALCGVAQSFLPPAPTALRHRSRETPDDPACVAIVQPGKFLATNVERDQRAIGLPGRDERQAHLEDLQRVGLVLRHQSHADRFDPPRGGQPVQAVRDVLLDVVQHGDVVTNPDILRGEQ